MKNLRTDLLEVAPSVSDLAWGHKYFSLLSPERLDDYHNADYQRFHLVKMLQVPPGGGRSLPLRRPLRRRCPRTRHPDQPPNKDPQSPRRAAARLLADRHLGRAAAERPMAADAGRGCVAIGWPDLGDLSGYRRTSRPGRSWSKCSGSGIPADPSRSQGGERSSNSSRGSPEAMSSWPATVQTVLGVGRVTGEYSYEAGLRLPAPPTRAMALARRVEDARARGAPDDRPPAEEVPVNIVEAERRSLGGPIVVTPLQSSPVAPKGAGRPDSGASRVASRPCSNARGR